MRLRRQPWQDSTHDLLVSCIRHPLSISHPHTASHGGKAGREALESESISNLSKVDGGDGYRHEAATCRALVIPNDLPELGSNLVTALPSLDVNDLSHFLLTFQMANPRVTPVHAGPKEKAGNQ